MKIIAVFIVAAGLGHPSPPVRKTEFYNDLSIPSFARPRDVVPPPPHFPFGSPGGGCTTPVVKWPPALWISEVPHDESIVTYATVLGPAAITVPPFALIYPHLATKKKK